MGSAMTGSSIVLCRSPTPRQTEEDQVRMGHAKLWPGKTFATSYQRRTESGNRQEKDDRPSDYLNNRKAERHGDDLNVMRVQKRMMREVAQRDHVASGIPIFQQIPDLEAFQADSRVIPRAKFWESTSREVTRLCTAFLTTSPSFSGLARLLLSSTPLDCQSNEYQGKEWESRAQGGEGRQGWRNNGRACARCCGARCSSNYQDYGNPWSH